VVAYVSLKGSAGGADLFRMARGFGVLSLVASLVIAGMIFAMQMNGGGSRPSPAQENGAVREANNAAASLAMVQAERELTAYQAEHGTFAGAKVTGITGVTVLHADATTFCLQIGTGAGLVYEAGPGGSLTSQRC
jgi:hypothetical protein